MRRPLSPALLAAGTTLLLLAAVLTCAAPGALPTAQAMAAALPVATPAVKPAAPAPSFAATPASVADADAIIIDHTTTDISRIPPAWLLAARQLSLHYAHTSHGSQLLTGAEWLMAQDPQYAIAVQYDLPPQPAGGALRVYDGNNYGGNNYIVPEMYWSTDDGMDHTRAVAASGAFDISMWAWCGQQSSNDTATVDQYLATLTTLGTEYPAIEFVYFTGHTDGGSPELARNNSRVRDYVLAQGKVLFDFADIESYDPAGNYYGDTDDSCPWCAQWCSNHPDDCAGLPLDQPDWCAHSHPFNCLRKAGAFWWMMARLAGWDGLPADTTPTVTATPTATATTTFVAPATAPPTATATPKVTDLTPAIYLPGLSAPSP